MKRLLASLLFAFLSVFFAAAAAGQTNTTVSNSCNGCHGNVYALLTPTAVLRHGGYSALVNTMNANTGGSFSANVSFIIGWLETNYPWASPPTLPSGPSGSPYGPVTISSNGGTSPFTWS